MLKVDQIIEVFDRLFSDSHNTCLRGGAVEPLYEPASAGHAACVFFREDFAASALHEVAHWCIAGPERRQQIDYGYWYNPDGRSSEAQALFLRVEAKPQALEWCFALAAGVPFRLSMDNLDAPVDRDATALFAGAVASQARRFAKQGLPPRGRQMFDALGACSGRRLAVKMLDFPQDALR